MQFGKYPKKLIPTRKENKYYYQHCQFSNLAKEVVKGEFID
jgi:hypothetical protein